MYSVHRHVRVSRVLDVCDVSIQCPYTDEIVFVMYMTRAVNIVYSSSHDYTVPIYGYDIFCRIHVLYMTRAVNIVYRSSRDYAVPIYGYDIFCRIHVLYITRAVTLTLCTLSRDYIITITLYGHQNNVRTSDPHSNLNIVYIVT